MTFAFFVFNDTATTEIYTVSDTLSLHDALPIFIVHAAARPDNRRIPHAPGNFPRQAGSRGGCGNVAIRIDGHAWNRTGRRMCDYALGVRYLFFIAVENRRNMFFPLRRI